MHVCSFADEAASWIWWTFLASKELFTCFFRLKWFLMRYFDDALWRVWFLTCSICLNFCCELVTYESNGVDVIGAHFTLPVKRWFFMALFYTNKTHYSHHHQPQLGTREQSQPRGSCETRNRGRTKPTCQGIAGTGVWRLTPDTYCSLGVVSKAIVTIRHEFLTPGNGCRCRVITEWW